MENYCFKLEDKIKLLSQIFENSKLFTTQIENSLTKLRSINNIEKANKKFRSHLIAISGISSRIVSHLKYLAILTEACPSTPEYDPNFSFNFSKWKPICFNDSKSLKKLFNYEEIKFTKNLNSKSIIGTLKSLMGDLSFDEKTLARRLVDKRDLYKNFLIELYKGGWNSGGEFQGYGIHYELEKEGMKILSAYKGDFLNGKNHGSGMFFKFDTGERPGTSKVKVIFREFESGKLGDDHKKILVKWDGRKWTR